MKHETATIYSLPLRILFTPRNVKLDAESILIDWLAFAADRADVAKSDWRLAFVLYRHIKDERKYMRDVLSGELTLAKQLAEDEYYQNEESEQ